MTTSAIVMSLFWNAFPYLIMGGVSIFTYFKTKSAKRSVATAEVSLQGLIAMLELAPQTPDIISLKAKSKQLQLLLGTEGTRMAPLVDQALDALREAKLINSFDQTDPASLSRAAQAIAEIRGLPVLPPNPDGKGFISFKMLIATAVTGLMLTSCIYFKPAAPARKTVETYWAATDKDKAVIIVEWPQDVTSGTLWVRKVDGRILTGSVTGK